MQVFLNLIPQILPLYVIIIFGYFAAKHFALDKESISKLSIYFLVPLVMFYGVMKSNFSVSLIFIPITIWAISTMSALIVFWLSRKVMHQNPSYANILALSAGTGNSGYFGIPVAAAIFPPELVGLYITSILGMTIFQNTVGFYITATSNFTARDSILKLIKLPIIYAFILGILFNYLKISIPSSLENFFLNTRGAYVYIGMLVIGASIAQMKKFQLNVKFTSFALFGRMIIWPALALSIFYFDSHYIGFFDPAMLQVIKLACIVPLAADTVALAAILRCNPEEMASAVVFSTTLALIYVPLMISLFIL